MQLRRSHDHRCWSIRCFLTARDSAARLTEQLPLGPCAGEPSLPSVWVDTQRTFQTIRTGDVFYEQGRLREALAKLEATLALAGDERLPAGAASVFEEAWYDLAEAQVELGLRAGAERTRLSAAAATEVGAAQFPEDSPRRRMTLGRPRAERAWLALQSGEPEIAFRDFQSMIRELEQIEFPPDEQLAQSIQNDYLSWMLGALTDAAIQLSRFQDAEAAARRRIGIPDSAFGDVVRGRGSPTAAGLRAGQPN